MESNSQSIVEKFQQLLEEKGLLTSIYPSPDAQIIKSDCARPTKTVHESAIKKILKAETIKGTKEAQVNAKDGRVPVDKPADWPHSVHGVVSFLICGVLHWGTGTMIGPNVVLTAGHNLYNHKKKAYAEDVQFLPGMNGYLLPLGMAEAEKYFVSPKFIEDEEAETEDYGLIFLKEAIGEKTGYFGLACLTPEAVLDQDINVTGYPGDKVANKPPHTYEMWEMTGRASSIQKDKGEIYYMIDTGTGQSGGGVWYQEKGSENYYVCGVHVRGKGRLVNIATLLTRVMYEQIHKWLQEAKSKEFLFKEKYRDKNDYEFELELGSKDINTKCLSLLMSYKFAWLCSLNLSNTRIGSVEAYKLAKNTSWTNLQSLYLYSNNIDSEGAKALAQNTSWTNLRQLYLSENNIDSKGAKALAQNTSWTNLQGLDLFRNKIDSEGAKALAQNISWTDLRELYLSENNIDSEGAKALAQNTSWTNLQELYLSENNIDSEGAKALAQNTSWTNLKVLYLPQNNIDSEGAKALAQNTSWTNLRWLYLSDNNIDSEGAKALAQNTSWTNLWELYLDSNKIDSKGAKALAQNISWTDLRQLYLSQNNIDSEGAKALTQNISWTDLRELYLSENNIDSEGAKALAQNTSWTNLNVLYLSENNIDSEGAKALAQNTSWTNLWELRLSENNIDSKGAKALAQNTSWTNLRRLDLSGNKIDSEGARVLKQNKYWKNASIHL